MDMISLAREIGKELQKDERYLNMQTAKKNSDEDTGLQNLIGEFNLKRMAINHEAQSESPDSEKIQALNQELRGVYTQIMQNANMIAYNQAKDELDALLKRVSAIIGQSADGEDPETTDLEESSCGGDCSACGGCH
ncbi:MAG: YlbF family regulator [Clostridiales bacterium]|nr:YlbF family regulator [Clostridiales bacterium]